MSMHTKQKPKSIIIVGCGRYGLALAAILDARGDNVMVVDPDAHAFTYLPDDFNGTCIAGNAGDADILELSGIRRADCVIAVTEDENVNLMVAQFAKAHYQVGQAIALIDDDSNQAAYNDIGILTICPVLLTANELCQSIFGAKEGMAG